MPSTECDAVVLVKEWCFRPTRYNAHLSHTRYYVQVAQRTDVLYKRGNDAMMEGLALFDRERDQIDAGWAWVRSQPPSKDSDLDNLLIDYAKVARHSAVVVL